MPLTITMLLQVTLPRPLLITGMKTQGAPVEDARIVSLRLQFSKDCITFVNHTRVSTYHYMLFDIKKCTTNKQTNGNKKS